MDNAERYIESDTDGYELIIRDEDKTPIGALKLLLEGIKSIITCIDHTDCLDDYGAMYHGSVENAENIIRKKADKLHYYKGQADSGRY